MGLISRFSLMLFLLTAMSSVPAFGLPPEAQRDVLILKLAEHLKAERWEEAYPLFPKIEAIVEANNLETDDALDFYHGEVAFHLKSYPESYNYLSSYASKAGSGGAFYIKCLTMISTIEDVDLNYLARSYMRSHAKRQKEDPKDKSHKEKAIRIFKLSAELGNAKSYFALANMSYVDVEYYNKYGKSNKAEAISWLLKVTKRPESFTPSEVREAQKNIGGIYQESFMNEDTPEQDGPLAIKWWTLAANESAGNGNPNSESLDSAYSIEARMRLADLYRAGRYEDVIPKDWVTAARLYESIKYTSNDEPAEWHKSRATYGLGEIYSEGGSGIEKNLPAAENLFRLCLAKCQENWLLKGAKQKLKQMGVTVSD